MAEPRVDEFQEAAVRKTFGLLQLELLDGLREVADPHAVVVSLEARRALGPELDEQGAESCRCRTLKLREIGRRARALWLESG